MVAQLAGGSVRFRQPGLQAAAMDEGYGALERKLGCRRSALWWVKARDAGGFHKFVAGRKFCRRFVRFVFKVIGSQYDI